MKEYDRVELTAEKECYTQEGVRKGMTGWICDPRNIDGAWLVCFDEDEHFSKFPILAVNEEDMLVIS